VALVDSLQEAYGLEVQSKLLRSYRFFYAKDGVEHARRQMAQLLDRVAFPDSFERLFAFDFAPAALQASLADSPSSGSVVAASDAGVPLPAWSLHEQLAEIARLRLVPRASLPADAVAVGDARNQRVLAELGAAQGAKKPAAAQVADDDADGGATAHRLRSDGAGWRLTQINADYQFCNTYPALLVVPATVDDDALRKVGQFRSRHRLPACVYVHHKTRAAMARCSQPLVGLRRSRCSEDEMLLDAMRLSNPTDTSTLRIFDARPKVNADANRLKGGGYESYDGCQLEFSNIENIHVMRDSLAKLMRACQTSRMDVYDGNQSELDRDVAASAWLTHVRRILHATNRVVHALERTGSTVLLHCSDGWDRTAQVSALAQIMLEPYHRTIEGFFVVVAKEWLSFGHKFGERHGHGENMANHKDSQRSPVFLQFLDCCWQLLQQFPTAFEFAEPLLLAVRTHLYSSLFGTFLCDSDAERAAARLSQRTLSLFDVLLVAASREHASPLRNSAYVPTKATLVAQADPDDPQEMLARVWLAAYAEGSINDKTATYPDTARRVFAVADAPDAPEATLAAHHLCGLTTPAYVRSLRRQQRSARKGSRRHTVSDLSRSKNSDAGHSDTTTADDADQLPSSGSSSEHRKKRRDSAAAAATAATAAASGSSTSTTGAAAAAAASAAGDRKPRRDRAKNVLPSTPSEL
jgi:hypothetical protein